MRHTIVIILQFLAVFQLHAQISGRITESRSGKAIPEAEIFIQGRSVSALSDQDGNFVLNGISAGFADVIVYKKGYPLFKSSIRLEKEKAYSVNLSLPFVKANKSKKTRLNTDQLRFFLQAITGSSDSTDFILTNPLALRQETKNGQTITADEPLLIIHENLGYQIRYYLSEGSQNVEKARADGYFTFIPLQPRGSEEAMRWATNRLNQYHGSLQHLLSSMVSGSIVQEGFEFVDGRGQPVNAANLVAPSIPNYHSIKIEAPMTVRYKDASGTTNTSQLIPNGSLQTTNEGNLLIRNNLEVIGPLAWQSNPLVLPQDYVPIMPAADDFMRFYEKIYIQTDKPYYYPGEPLWFKGYINYFNPTWRDSLSRVVYVEIIYSTKSILTAKVLRIDSGLFHGDFILPDTLKSGDYYLRAYTQLQRNYGDEHLYMKSIPVLTMTEKADPAQAVIDSYKDERITIATDKPSYKPREGVKLNIRIKDNNNKPVAAQLSLAVTDAFQVIPVQEASTILTEYPIDRSKSDMKIEFKYPVEFGVGFSGRFLNDKGKPEKTSLTIIQLKPRNVQFAESNTEGYFSLTGSQFYDTAVFAFKSDKANERPYGKVEILSRVNPPIHSNISPKSITVMKTETAQRLISEYEVPKDTKLLEGITVKASRLPQDEYDQPDYRVNRPYGKPDYVLTQKDLRLELGYGNLVYHLQGKVPGLGAGMTFLRTSTQSINNGGSPLVTINNIPMQGSALEVLSMIDPSTVESVEFTPRINVLYGSQGAFGVIAVYTKTGSTPNTAITPNFQQLVVKGFDRSRDFTAPDYGDKAIDLSKPDYRATLYWNPQISTSSSSGISAVSFFSADLPGRYRVVVEGITQTGEPIRAVLFIEVESN